jgi:uncharacterized protein (TIGR02246 family)
MKNSLKLVAGLVFLSAITAGCARKDTDDKEDSAKAMASATPAAAAFDKSAAEAEIRKGDEAYFNAVKARDAAAVAALYAEDAVSMPPNSPPLEGREAVRKSNEGFLKTPQLSMTGEATSIKFSDDGSMAYETGKYTASFVDAKGKKMTDDGKFLNVLKKENGKWVVVADAFSSNKGPSM